MFQATWGIERVTERLPNLDGQFVHNPTWGEKVVSYIIDTGIYLEHTEFGGRAVWGGNFVDDEGPFWARTPCRSNLIDNCFTSY